MCNPVLIAFMAWALAAPAAFAAEPEEQPVASAERGQEIFEKLCVHCHRTDGHVSKTGASGMAGVTARRDAGWLDNWLKNPAEFAKEDEVARAIANSYKFGMAMPALSLMQEADKRADVIEYLKTLTREEAKAAE